MLSMGSNMFSTEVVWGMYEVKYVWGNVLIYIYIYIRRPLPTAGGARQRRDSKQCGPWPAGPVRPSGPCCFAVARAPFVSFVGGWKTATASFLVGSESNVRSWGAFPAGPVRPSGPCCFAVARAPFVSLVGGWKTASCFAVARAPFVSLVGGWKTASFLVGSESNVRHWGPLPAGPVRASEPCCFAVARVPFVSFLGGGWKTATERLGPSLRALLVCCGEGAVCEPSLAAGRQLAVFFAVARAPFVSLVGGWKTASFLVGSESNVRHWGPLPAGPVRPSGPCCFAVARAPFVSFLGGWKTASFLVGSESNVRHWGGRCPQARSVHQGPAVSLWRGRRLWALLAAGRWPAVSLWRGRRLWALLAAGRQLVFL